MILSKKPSASLRIGAAIALVLAPLLAAWAFESTAISKAWSYAGMLFALLVLIWRDDLSKGSLHRFQWVTGIIAGFIAGGIILAGYQARVNHVRMGEYDFFALYLDAFVAWRGLDFYEPTNYQNAFNAIAPPFENVYWGFQRNVLETGTKYPPPTLLLLAPFGALDRLPAHIAWVAGIWASMLAATWLLWRKVLDSRSLFTLSALFALVLVSPGTRLNLELEQMHFPALVFLLLAFIHRHRAPAGLWIAVGTLVKPPIAAGALYALRGRQWSSLTVLGIATVLICSLSIFCFGWDVFTRFFTDNPNLRVSDSLYSENMNRSLLAHVIREFGWDFANGPPMGHPVFRLAAALITLITLVGVFLSKNRRDDHVYGLLFCFALLIYPGTQKHYAVLLLLPLLSFLHTAERDGVARWFIALAALGIATCSASRTFLAVFAMWGTFLFMIALARVAGAQKKFNDPNYTPAILHHVTRLILRTNRH
ncbi:MAG: glycosyltransferase family 87 protein [Verrucomicrobiota bacterium]